MPFIQQVYEDWSDTELVILAINIGEGRSNVEKFMGEYNLSFPVLLDTKQEVAEQYNVRGIPTTLFINKDGIIESRKVGAFINAAEIENSLSNIVP